MEEDELGERMEAAYHDGYEAGLEAQADGDEFVAVLVIGGIGAFVGFIAAVFML